MELARPHRLVPVAMLALGVLAVLASVPLASAGGTLRGDTALPACESDGGPPDGAPGSPRGQTGSSGGPAGPPTAWYRLDPVLDASGTLAGQRLLAGMGAEPAHALALAPESFASGPAAGRIVVGSDDGRRSELLALDPVRRCVTSIALERAAVVRSAIAAPDGRWLYEHRVDRQTRADLGVWRRELDRWRQAGPADRVLDPVAPDPAYGPVFTTDLRLSADGSLVASSCGVRLCRIRVLAPTGRVTSAGPTGPAIGSVDGRIIARAPIGGHPSALLAHEPDGSVTPLVPAAGGAALGGEDGGVLVYTDAAGALRMLDLRTRRMASADAGGLAVAAGGSLATSGASAGPGDIVLAPHGRVTDAVHAMRLIAAGSNDAHLVHAVPEALP